VEAIPHRDGSRWKPFHIAVAAPELSLFKLTVLLELIVGQDAREPSDGRRILFSTPGRMETVVAKPSSALLKNPRQHAEVGSPTG
jgi:hypothetical protein